MIPLLAAAARSAVPWRAVVAAVALVAAFSVGMWTGVKVEQGIVAKDVAKRAADDLAAQTTNRAREREAADAVSKAINEARQREHAAHVAATGARVELDELRKRTSAIRAGLPGATAAACSVVATTASELLDQCAAAYQGMAAAADAHASDTITLEQAWPK